MLKAGGGLVCVDVQVIFWTGGSNVIGLFKIGGTVNYGYKRSG